MSKEINGYKIGKQIGKGGNGTVYECFKNNVKYAIKVVKYDGRKHDSVERFKRECEFMKEASCPNIVKCYDYGICGNLYYSVMEYKEKNFREIMNNYNLTFENKLKLFLDVCSALKYAHNYGNDDDYVIHRDIKPENILVDKNNNNAYLSDFGIAHFSKLSSITRAKDKVANFVYAAPEQREMRKEDVNRSTDIYSMGLILNEIFTKHLPIGMDYKEISEVSPKFFELDNVVADMISYDSTTRLDSIDRVIFRIKRMLFEFDNLRDDVKDNLLSIGTKRNEIFNVAVDDCSQMVNILNNKKKYQNLKYDYHANIKYELSSKLINSLFLAEYAVKDAHLKRQRELANHKTEFNNKNFELLTLLEKWLNSLDVFPEFECYKNEIVECAFFLLDYHSSELLRDLKNKYQDYQKKNKLIAINELTDLITRLYELDDLLRDKNLFCFFKIDYNNSYFYKEVLNDDYFVNNVDLDEIKVKDLMIKYKVIFEKHFEDGLLKYLLYVPNDASKNLLIQDIRKAQKKFSKKDDVRIYDLDDLINKINDYIDSDMFENTSLLDEYDLDLMYNALLSNDERNEFIRGYYDAHDYFNLV